MGIGVGVVAGSDREQLFRREVLAASSERLQGTVSIAVPVSWQVIGGLLVLGVASALAFLALATYARIETVPGVIALDRGVAAMLPSRTGVVMGVMVREGERVAKGQALVAISSEEALADGGSAPERVRAALGEQDFRLASQGAMVADAARADAARLKEQIDGARAEVAGFDA